MNTLSYESSKQLYEAGFEFERTEKAYLLIEGKPVYQGVYEPKEREVVLQIIASAKPKGYACHLIPAPVFDDIWSVLPAFVEVAGHVFHLRCRKGDDKTTLMAYKSDVGAYYAPPVGHVSSVEAAAQLLQTIR